MKLQKLAGATSEIWQIFIADSSSTTGGGLTGLLFNTASLTAYYHRDTDTTATAITLVTMTVGTFTSSGFKEIDATNLPGWYQFCPPNAALASGAKSCGFLLKGATNMAPLPIEVQLTAVNPDSATAFLTSVATVTTVTNQLTAAQIATGIFQDTTAGDFTVAGSIGKSLFTSGNAPGAASGLALVGSNMGTVSSVTGSVGSVTGAVGSVTGAVGSVTGAVGSVTGAVGSIASGGITRASLAADTGLQSLRSNTAQAGSATSITLDASASASNNFYNNCLILITGGTGVGQARFITAYVGATKVATVATWVTTPDVTSTFAILPFDAVAGASAPTAAQVATAVWTDLLASSDFSTASSVGALLKTDIDAAISSRMATYTQPTGFLAATFPSGTVASTTNITAGIITTVTNLTNAPTAGDLTTTMKTSIGTAVAASAVASVTGNVGGNVVGSVASVTGAVGSVTAAVTVTGDLSATMKTSVTTAATAATPTALLTSGTGTGQVSLASGILGVDLKKINGTTVNGNGSTTPWGP